MGRRERRCLVSLAVTALIVTAWSCAPEPEVDASVSIALPIQTRSLDPGFAGGRYDRELWTLIYSRLLSVDPQTGRIHALAADNWTVSGDGLRWTFYLREDLRYHDGRRVTAEDVAASLRRLVDPRLGSELGRYLYVVSGARQTHLALSPRNLGIYALSDHVLEIALDAPAPQLPAVLSEIGFITAVEDDGISLQPLYSGAFAVVEAVGETVSLVKNPHFRPPAHAESMSTAPLASTVPTDSARRMTVIRAGSPSRALRLLSEGAVDFAVVDSREGLAVPEDAVVERTVPLPVVHHLHFNTARSPTNRRPLRNALAASARLASGDIPEGAALLSGIAAPGTLAAPKARRLPDNEALARYELARLGGVDDGVVRVARTAGASAGAVVDAVTAIWREGLGVESEVTILSRKMLASAADAGFNVIRAGHVSPYPDAHAVFRDLFHSALGVDWPSLADPRVDELIEAAGVETDATRRRRYYSEAEFLLVDEYSVTVPLYMDRRITLSRD